jgi:hypothetical protein
VGICPEADFQKHVCDNCFKCPANIDWFCSDPSMPLEWYALYKIVRNHSLKLERRQSLPAIPVT